MGAKKDAGNGRWRRRLSLAKAKSKRYHMPPLRIMLPITAAIVFFFLGLPALVFISFGLEHPPTWLSSKTSNANLRGNMDITKYEYADCLEVEATADRNVIRTRCLTGATPPVPSIVHFIHLPEQDEDDDAFSLVQFADVQSVRSAMQPTSMVLHHVLRDPPSTTWFRHCQDQFSFHRIRPPPLPSKSSLSPSQRHNVQRFLLQLRVLREQGGVAFADFNTVMLQPFKPWQSLSFMAGRSISLKDHTLCISTHMLQATPGNAHVQYLETTLQQMLQQDDPRLGAMPFECLVGDLLLQHLQSESKPEAVVTAASVFDAVASDSLDDLMQPQDQAKSIANLTHAFAFHLDGNHPGLARLQQILSLDDLAVDRSQLGIILRKATGDVASRT